MCCLLGRCYQHSSCARCYPYVFLCIAALGHVQRKNFHRRNCCSNSTCYPWRQYHHVMCCKSIGLARRCIGICVVLGLFQKLGLTSLTSKCLWCCVAITLGNPPAGASMIFTILTIILKSNGCNRLRQLRDSRGTGDSPFIGVFAVRNASH